MFITCICISLYPIFLKLNWDPRDLWLKSHCCHYFIIICAERKSLPQVGSSAPPWEHGMLMFGTHALKAITVIYYSRRPFSWGRPGFWYSPTGIVLGAFNNSLGSSSHPGLWMVLADPIVCLQMSWSFCSFSETGRIHGLFSSHFVGNRLCCFIWLFLCEMIFDWEGDGSRRTASTLFGFLESFGNETIEPVTEKEFGGLCCHGLIVTLKMEGTKGVIISGILPSLPQPFSLFFNRGVGKRGSVWGPKIQLCLQLEHPLRPRGKLTVFCRRKKRVNVGKQAWEVHCLCEDQILKKERNCVHSQFFGGHSSKKQAANVQDGNLRVKEGWLLIWNWGRLGLTWTYWRWGLGRS